MNRERMMELLTRYVDGNVSQEERDEVDAAVASSDSWRGEWVYLQRIQGAVSRRRATSPGLWEGIAARIEAEAKIPNVVAGSWAQFEWAGRRLAPLFAAAAVILLALMGTNGTQATATTYEDFLLAQWEGEGAEAAVVSEDALTADDVLYFSLEE